MNGRGWLVVGALLALAASCGEGREAPAPATGTPSVATAPNGGGSAPSVPPVSPTSTVPPRPAVPASARTPTDEILPLVGLVASDDDAVTDALAAGLRYAFDAARTTGGPDVELRVGSRDNRWASEAAAAVTLALDEGAIAIVTPPERRRAHILAQFATKGRVPVISTSPAASVMAAGSIWVMSVVPPGEPPEIPADFARAFRAATGTDATPWTVAGDAAGRAALTAIAKNGLRRDGFIDAATGAR